MTPSSEELPRMHADCENVTRTMKSLSVPGTYV